MIPVPKIYQDFVYKIGGRNRFGDPNWRIVWGPDRLEIVAGAWQDADGTTRVESRWVRKYGDKEVFHLEKWCDPSMYGDPAMWEFENALTVDGITPDMGIQLLGAFPWRGEYEHSFTLSGRLYFYTLEKLIRLNLRGDNASAEERKKMREEEREKKRQEWIDMVVDIYKDRAPAFYGPVSFAGQKQHTALLDRVDAIVKQLENGISGEEIREKLGLGLKQTN
jgi:hypothetical protein